MFDLSLGEIAVIGLLILVFFDVDQLPGLMRQAGRMYAKVRSASDELRRAFNTEVARAEADQRRDDLMRRRDEVSRLKPNRPSVPPRAAPDDTVMRLTRVNPTFPADAAPAPADPAPGADPAPAADPTPTPAPDPASAPATSTDSDDSGGGT